MTYKEYEATKKRIKSIFAKWKEPLNLKWWRNFNVTFSNQYKQDSTSIVADCAVNWRYMAVELTFYLPACVELSISQLEHTALHEVLHAYLDELTSAKGQEDLEGHEERVCTQLAMIIKDVRDYAAKGKLNVDS